MDLGNLVKVVVRYLLIGRMTYLDCRDRLSMGSTLVCMITHWIGPIVNHDVRLLYCHDSPNYYIYCMDSQS